MVKDFQTYLSQVQAQFPTSTQAVQRVMRSFRVKLVHQFVTKVVEENCLRAQKVQLLQACERLRHFSHFFSADENADDGQILKPETSSFVEFQSYHYQPRGPDDDSGFNAAVANVSECKPLSTQSLEILDVRGIPSSQSVCMLDML